MKKHRSVKNVGVMSGSLPKTKDTFKTIYQKLQYYILNKPGTKLEADEFNMLVDKLELRLLFQNEQN